MILTVHDELVFEVKREAADEVAALVREKMMGVAAWPCRSTWTSGSARTGRTRKDRFVLDTLWTNGDDEPT